MFHNRSKEIDLLQKEISKQRPLPEKILSQIKEYYRIGLTYNSNALEGNTLTETETKIILEDGLTIGGKSLREHFEVIGHSKAYDYMLSLTQAQTITEQDILTLHKLFYQHIDQTKTGNQAGVYRNIPIIVTGTDYTFPAPTQLPKLMQAFVATIPELQKQYHPVEYAARLHLELVTIHPFIDGNGRTARLLMNLALLQHGYTITIIPAVLRREYLSAVRQGNKGNAAPFVNFISQMVYESQKDYVRILTAMTTY